MHKNNITFVLFAYNEEKRIEYPIRNFIKYGEVIVIDNFSTDKTKKVAEQL
jgi:glycosyltransferase involved in cell wall biosynthesis